MQGEKSGFESIHVHKRLTEKMEFLGKIVPAAVNVETSA